MTTLMNYAFEAIEHCEMCGAPDSRNKILGQRMNRRQGLRTGKLQGISTTIKRCRSCGLVYPNPLPIPKQLSDHYSILPEEYWQKQYFRYDPSYFQAQTHKALELGVHSASGRPTALDIGCGIGKALITLRNSGFQAWGLEPSPSFYERAVAFTELPEDQLINVSIENAMLPIEYFDFITFGAVFEHLYHPKKCLQNALQWLKPGGLIHIEVPSSNWLIEHIYHVALKLKGSELTSFLSPMHSPFHLYAFSLNSFKEIEHELGFKLIDSRIDVCQVMYFPSFMRPLVGKLMDVTATGMQLTLWLQKQRPAISLA